MAQRIFRFDNNIGRFGVLNRSGGDSFGVDHRDRSSRTDRGQTQGFHTDRPHEGDGLRVGPISREAEIGIAEPGEDQPDNVRWYRQGLLVPDNA